ncbi:MAG: hypothetical protein EOM20_14785 [Spartobacteria bacterium]|nr:hypothetical protein [Spartobacteria bacterium]
MDRRIYRPDGVFKFSFLVYYTPMMMKYLTTCLLTVVLSQSLIPSAHARKWRTYEDCELDPNPSNDGDSFHVKYKTDSGRNRYYLLRLYFVDTPESEDSLPERLQEQADYFGITPDEVVKLGKQATKFTEKFLKKGFTFYTKHADARGRSQDKRRYSMVKVGDQYLAEALVANGLARVFGNKVDLPDGTSAKVFEWRLNKFEREAKRNKLGGWAPNVSRMQEMQQRAGILPNAPQSPAQAPPDISLRTAQALQPEESAAVEEQDLTLAQSIAVYSLKDADRKVGILRAGTTVRVLGEASAGMIRIRFRAGEGKIYEAQCRRVDAGI